MFVIEITYKVPLEQIEEQFANHVSFLEKYFAAGNFLLSGRKIPREGGIILATATNKEQLNEIIKEDPFYYLQLADFRIVEFNAGRKATRLSELIVQLS